jgi:hypothetical protein
MNINIKFSRLCKRHNENDMNKMIHVISFTRLLRFCGLSTRIRYSKKAKITDVDDNVSDNPDAWNNVIAGVAAYMRAHAILIFRSLLKIYDMQYIKHTDTSDATKLMIQIINDE